MSRKMILTSTALASALTFGMVFAQSTTKPSTAMPSKDSMSSGTIADVVSKDPQFSTLLAALKAAGLDKTLAGKGPFTVFAPTNKAFAKIPKATLDALLKNKAELTKVLTYHVVSGKVTAAEVMKMTSAKTVEGSDVKISMMGKNVDINNAMVTKADIMASNGIIHVIDTVLMPPASK